MADYSDSPLWDEDTGTVPLSELPISDPLKHRLTAWRERWEEINDAAIASGDFDIDDSDHEREKHDLWMALREELGTDFEVGLSVASPGGPDTRIHVIWEPEGEPELPVWHQLHGSASGDDA